MTPTVEEKWTFTQWCLLVGSLTILPTTETKTCI
jgi:hypothetical protein